jgi:tRNA(Ile)-lysidine synthase
VIAEPPAALSTAAFARLMTPFEPFESAPVVAVAVSGGRDSLALTLLAGDWAQGRGGRAVGLIVDHGLRPESRAEAGATREVLARHGLEAAVLSWSGRKPSTGVQAAARAARYRLLREECRRRGIVHLLLGHHADDQAETMVMRAARGSGVDGLAGMAALVEMPELRLLRPLLGVPRARLTATLMARGVSWLDDPSNAAPRFERARLRLRGQPLHAPRTADRAARERTLAEAAADVVEVDQEGIVAFDQVGFACLNGDLQARLLSRTVQALAGRDHPPRQERLKKAISRLTQRDRGKSGRAQDFTLSGCALMLRQVPQGRRLRWIVRAERGRNMSQPLIPAAFFACGTTAASHLE